MLWGFFSTAGGSVAGLAPRLRAPAPDAETLMSGRLALGWEPDSDVSRLQEDGITCVVHGWLYEPARYARELGVSGATPAEIILRAYRAHGARLLATLRGHFSVALWNSVRAEGFLASDILSTKPVFVRHGVGWVAFASELTPLLEVLPSRPGPDPAAFASWIGGGGSVPAGRTLFDGVTKLLPGQFIRLTAVAAEPAFYWRPAYAGTRSGTRDEHADGLREQLDEAVARRLSPRSSAVILSGGVDSSIVTAVASAVRPNGAALRTYSTAFPDYPDLDETWKVRSLTGSLGVDAAGFETLPQGAVRLALEHARRWNDPLQGAGALIDAPLVSAAAGDGAQIVLDGQLGDEVLGFAPYLIADRVRGGRILSAWRLAGRWPAQGRAATNAERRWVIKNFGIKGAAPYRLGRTVREQRRSPDAGPEWLLPGARADFLAAEDNWAWKQSRGPRWWRHLSDSLVDFPHRIARFDYVRHRAAAAGVASASPLYDFDLIQYCLSLPPELGFDESLKSRPLARYAMRDRIPDDVRLNDRKANFSPFCFDILTGPDSAAIERLLTSGDAELGAYVDMDSVARLWRNRPTPGPRSTMAWGSQLWMMIAAESWLRCQSDPEFVEKMLERSDLPRLSQRRTGFTQTGTFSPLAAGSGRV